MEFPPAPQTKAARLEISVRLERPIPVEACHCIELPFVFGNLGAWGDKALILEGASMEEMEQLREYLIVLLVPVHSPRGAAADSAQIQQESTCTQNFRQPENCLKEIVL